MFCFNNKKRCFGPSRAKLFIREPFNQICRAFAESRSTEARVKKSRLLFVPLFHVNKHNGFSMYRKCAFFFLSIFFFSSQLEFFFVKKGRIFHKLHVKNKNFSEGRSHNRTDRTPFQQTIFFLNSKLSDGSGGLDIRTIVSII